MQMINTEKIQEVGGNGLIKPTLLRLGSNISTITDASSVDDHDDEEEEEIGGPVMFTDSCPKCGSRKRRCLTPSFQPRKKPILINRTSSFNDDYEFFQENSIPRTSSIPLTTINSGPFLFPHQIPPPNSSSFIGLVPNSTPPPPSTNPSPIPSPPLQKLTVTLTPPRLQQCDSFVRSIPSKSIASPASPSVFSPSNIRKKLNSDDQMTILTKSARTLGGSPTFQVNSDSKAGDRRSDADKRLTRIKDGLKEVNNLLDDIIQEQKNVEAVAVEQVHEKIDNSKENREYYYETAERKCDQFRKR